MIQLYSMLYFFLVLGSSAIVTESTKGTPPVVPDHVKTRFVVQEGTKNWKLTCAAEGEPPLLITWTKDNEAITAAWPRFKQTNDAKDLKIKNVAMEDGGVYRCRAANGFGSVDIDYTIVVFSKDTPMSPISNDYPDDELEFDQSISIPSVSDSMVSGILKNEAPIWVNVPGANDPSTPTSSTNSQQPHSSSATYVRPVGGSLKLRCHAHGYPKPDIVWLKDGKELDDNTVFSWSRGKHALHLKDLRESDSGTYSCKIFNIFGSLNATFLVKVTNGDPLLPEWEKHPINSTVSEGQPASFQCRVRSIEKPVIQWIKVIEDPSHLEFNQSVEVQGLHITVLEKKFPSELEDFRNATWLKRLEIPAVAAQDAGWYVCFVTSQKGHFTHKSAYLQVNPVYQQVPINDQMPLHIVIGIPVAFILLLLVGYAIYFLQKHQQKPTLTGVLATNGQRPPPPPSYPPPSLPNSSALKLSPFRSSAAPITASPMNGQMHYNDAANSGSPSNRSRHQQYQQQQHQLIQHQSLLYAKENSYTQGPPPAPPSSVYKGEYNTKKLYHHRNNYHRNFNDLDPQSMTPLNGGQSDFDGMYESTQTPQPYELRYDDDSDFSDSYDENGRIQHYPSLYSCR